MEHKFYQALEDIFTGANIEGNGGYINLLKIKSFYYRQILNVFKDEVDKESILQNESFREEFFERLFSFFEKYFSETGSVYFVKTANWQRVYEKVYSDNKDVVLFWKTHMLFYVKSDILFNSMDIEIEDEETATVYTFFFDVGALQNKQNNEKKELVFSYKETKKDKHYFEVAYSEKNTQTKLGEIAKKIKVSEEILKKSFNTFKKQSEVDFFINKNAKKFLIDQLDVYLHQILLEEKNIFEQTRLTQLKTVKTFALKIIKFISQFEDELVRVWNKPKFALNSHYVITIDKLTDDLIKKITGHKNFKEQIKEWQKLGMIEKDFDFSKRTEKEKYLPVDTQYFKDIEIDILGLFDNLDEALDGRLIHSENYQALNTLQHKYKEKVQCIYIDPPFNTNSSSISYVNNYKHSSWITLMENRLSISKKLLKRDGINITAIDDIELRNLTLLQDEIFGIENYITTIITEANPQGRVANKVSKTTEFNILHSKSLQNIDKIEIIKNSIGKPTPLKRTGTNSKKEERPNRYYPILIKDNKIEMILEEEYHKIYKAEERFNDDFIKLLTDKYERAGYQVVFPKKEDGTELVWQRTFERVSKEKDTYIIKNNTIYTPYSDLEIPKTLWKDSIFSNPEYGSEYLKHLLGHNNFETPKSFHTIKQFFSIFDNNGIFMDYFGGSGTTAEAIIQMNKHDNGRRKYILVELGIHFNTVLLPRIKKVCFSNKWENGVTQKGEGITQFLKYYALEQYEQTLDNMIYEVEKQDIFNQKNPFEEYIFYADKKFAHVLELNKDKLKVDFDVLYKNIDFPETISNLLGLSIKRITKTTVVLQEGKQERSINYDYKNMKDKEKLEFVRLLQPLLWWGK